MNCLKCDAELVEKIQRIKWHAPVGKSKSALSIRSKLKRTWYCENCDQYYAMLKRLVPVEPY